MALYANMRAFYKTDRSRTLSVSSGHSSPALPAALGLREGLKLRLCVAPEAFLYEEQ